MSMTAKSATFRDYDAYPLERTTEDCAIAATWYAIINDLRMEQERTMKLLQALSERISPVCANLARPDTPRDQPHLVETLVEREIDEARAAAVMIRERVDDLLAVVRL